MKRVLKFYSVILLAFFFFSFIGVSQSFAVDSGVACDICGTGTANDHNCLADVTLKLICIENQCQESGKTTFCSFSSNKVVTDLIDKVSRWMLILGVVVAPLAILFGAFYMLTAAGDTKRSTKGKQIIIWASIGLAIILFARALVSVLRSFLW